MHQGNKVACVLPARELLFERSQVNKHAGSHSLLEGKKAAHYSLITLSFPAQRIICARAEGEL